MTEKTIQDFRKMLLKQVVKDELEVLDQSVEFIAIIVGAPMKCPKCGTSTYGSSDGLVKGNRGRLHNPDCDHCDVVCMMPYILIPET